MYHRTVEQDRAQAALERDGFRFANWVEPSDVDPMHPVASKMMVKHNKHGREYREIEPDGSIH